MPIRLLTNQSRKTSNSNNNTALARRKALSTYVYISGLTGVHTLETGLAYYYRGHYMYAYPAGNIIEPISYSTRKGIMIQGVVDAGAPVYCADAEGLLSEGEIAALEKSVRAEIQRKEGLFGEDALGTSGAEGGEVKNGGVDEGIKADHEAEERGLRRALRDAELQREVSSLAALRENGLKAFTPRHGALFLAVSAPGSRLASRSASPSDLRPVSSRVSLARLGAIRDHSSHSANTRCLEANLEVEDVLSRPSSAVGYLPGLGDHMLAAGDLARSTGPERVRPCAIYGEKCDGVSVERACLTEETKKGLGFVKKVPIIERGVRQMVDWASLLEETRADKGV
ncbi:hypothetical protein SLS61_000847 [Didymella pomorum]